MSQSLAEVKQYLQQKDNAQEHDTQSASTTSSTTELSQLESSKSKLTAALRQFPDFPIPGIDFIDILPLFANHSLHETLLDALELQIRQTFLTKPDVVIALDARGFLFGPSLALRLGCGFAPVRKPGKLPGPCESATYKKEYGEDVFCIQKDAFKSGQNVLIVDDIIATGGSAQAAGSLVQQLGGNLLGFLFILEIDFLKGRDQLSAPVQTLLNHRE